jgi:hypothetical protein
VFGHTTTPPNNAKDIERTKTSVFGNEMEATSYFKFPLVDLKALSKPAGRRKPLIGLLRGTGGGKTRSIYEIKYYFLHDDEVKDTLAISITYNSDWSYTDIHSLR